MGRRSFFGGVLPLAAALIFAGVGCPDDDDDSGVDDDDVVDDDDGTDDDDATDDDDSAESRYEFLDLCREGMSHEFPGEADFADPSDPHSHEMECWAWKTFYSLVSDPRAPSDNGLLPGNGTSPNETRPGDNKAAFEEWSATPNLFPDSPEFAENVPPPSGIPAFGAANQLVPKACSDLPGWRPDLLVLDQAHKSNDFFSEDGPLVDANGHFLRYQVLLNEAAWDYVVSNNLESMEGQEAASEVVFPCGDAAPETWSTVVKAAWKRIDVSQGDDPSQFHVRTAAVYTPAEYSSWGHAVCEIQDMALVGMHVALKTSSTQHWGWMTFEHVRNAPLCTSSTDTSACPTSAEGDWNLYKSNCEDCAACNTVPASNAGLDRNNDPWWVDLDAQSSQICRLNPIDGRTNSININIRSHFEPSIHDFPDTPDSSGGDDSNPKLPPPVTQIWHDGSAVWRNYELVGVQWTGLDTGGMGCGNVADEPHLQENLNPAILANTTMEAYAQDTSDCLSCHKTAMAHGGKSADFMWWMHTELHEPPSGGATGAGDANLQWIYDHVIQPRCAMCHSPTHFTGFQFTDAQTFHDVTVGQTSHEASPMNRITAGDPANSYLIHKLRGTQATAGSGAQMPLSGGHLDDATIDTIEAWITAGAPVGGGEVPN